MSPFHDNGIKYGIQLKHTKYIEYFFTYNLRHSINKKNQVMNT